MVVCKKEWVVGVITHITYRLHQCLNLGVWKGWVAVVGPDQ
jgi:hypothetical protein